MDYAKDIVEYLQENLALGQRVIGTGFADTGRIPQIVAMEFGRPQPQDALPWFLGGSDSKRSLAPEIELLIWREIKSYAYFITIGGEFISCKGSLDLADQLCHVLRTTSDDEQLKLAERIAAWNDELRELLR